jgi:C-terminal processing protease CtpA/Prc
LTLRKGTALGPALLIACLALPTSVGAQNTESDEQQPQAQSETQDQQPSDQGQSSADEQLPPQPSEDPSSAAQSQSQRQDEQGQQPEDDQVQSQYDQSRQQYDQSRQQNERQQQFDQRQQQFDPQFDQSRDEFDRSSSQFQRDRGADQRQQQRRQQFDRRQDRGAATDRARDDQRFQDGQFEQETMIRSAEDLGLQINERDNGLAVVDINRSSLLIDSGLRPGDVLVSVRNQPLRRSVDLVRWVRTLEPGARVPVQILRDGRRETIYITGIDFDRWQQGPGWYDAGDGSAYLGVVFDDRYPSVALVELVRPSTAADRAGLRPGDVIRRINGRQVNGLRHATALISQMQPGDEIELEFTRRTTAQAVARLGSRPDARQATFIDDGDFPAYGDREVYRDRVTEYSEEIRTFDDDDRRVRPLRDDDDDERIGERIRERAPLRRGIIRPFRNQ